MMTLAELLAMQQDNFDPGVQYNTGQPTLANLTKGRSEEEINQLLSGMQIRSPGFDPNFMAGEPYMPPQSQQMPQNYVQRGNNAPIDMGQRQPMLQNYIQRGNNAPIDLGQSQRQHDVYRDGPQVLGREQMPDGRTLVTQRVAARDGDGRMTTAVRQVIETPDYLNPAMLAKQKYEGQAANIAQTNLENKIKQTALDEDASLKAGNAMTAKQYERIHGRIPSGFEIYRTETGETDIRPVQGGKQYLELQDRVHKFDSSGKGMDEYGTQLDKLTNHPGRESATGFSSITNPLALPGGDAKDFLNELETFQSQAFLSNIDKLRGTGPLSNVEGEKLQAAVGNLNVSSNEETFKRNLLDVKRRFESLKEKAKIDADNARSEMKREKPKLTSADGEAMAWAMRNPTDPRAAAIKARLGVR